MPKVHWPQFQKDIDVKAGTTILDVALEHDIPLEHACGGFCACTTCHVFIKAGLENLSPMEAQENERLNPEKRKPESRLGCQAQIHGDVTIEIPKE